MKEKQVLLELVELLSCVDDLQYVIKLDWTDKSYIREKLALVKSSLAELERLNEHN